MEDILIENCSQLEDCIYEALELILTKVSEASSICIQKCRGEEMVQLSADKKHEGKTWRFSMQFLQSGFNSNSLHYFIEEANKQFKG